MKQENEETKYLVEKINDVQVQPHCKRNHYDERDKGTHLS